jgi:3D (Asp-Asp-Asp) domain-containing protein
MPLRLASPNLLAALTLGLLLLGCPVAEVSAQIQSGTSAYVLGTGGSGAKVRSGPGLSHDIRGTVSEGATVTIQDGPRTDGDLSWYQIRATDGAGGQTRGWVAGMYLVPTSKVTVGSGGALGTRKIEAKVLGYASGVGGVGYYTATGTRVRWGTVAVDPSYIPLGSLMIIDGLDGVFTAEDTGGGVRGAMVDVWFPDLASAQRWTTKFKTVTILREGY